MKTVILSLGEVRQDPSPSGKPFAGFRFSFAGLDSQPTTETSVEFTEVEPGTYTASVQAIDVDGNPMGSLVSVEVTVEADPPPVTFPQALGLTVQVISPSAPAA